MSVPCDVITILPRFLNDLQANYFRDELVSTTEEGLGFIAGEPLAQVLSTGDRSRPFIKSRCDDYHRSSRGTKYRT